MCFLFDFCDFRTIVANRCGTDAGPAELGQRDQLDGGHWMGSGSRLLKKEIIIVGLISTSL